MGEENFSGKEAFVQEALRAVEIGEDEVEEAGALGEAGLERGPIVGIEDEGDGVEIPGAVHAGGVAVDVVGDAVVVDELAGGVPAASEFAGAEVVEEIDEHLPVAANGTVGLLPFRQRRGRAGK